MPVGEDLIVEVRNDFVRIHFNCWIIFTSLHRKTISSFWLRTQIFASRSNFLVFAKKANLVVEKTFNVSFLLHWVSFQRPRLKFHFIEAERSD